MAGSYSWRCGNRRPPRRGSAPPAITIDLAPAPVAPQATEGRIAPDTIDAPAVDASAPNRMPVPAPPPPTAVATIAPQEAAERAPPPDPLAPPNHRHSAAVPAEGDVAAAGTGGAATLVRAGYPSCRRGARPGESGTAPVDRGRAGAGSHRAGRGGGAAALERRDPRHVARQVAGEADGASRTLEALSAGGAAAARGGCRPGPLRHRRRRQRALGPAQALLGHADLDEAVLTLVRRASPVPPPPGAPRDIVAPVQFNVR